VKAKVESLKMGDPAEPDTDMGPVIDARQQARIVDYIDGAVAEGATVALGGHALPGPGFWIEPTILTGVRNDMRIAQEEVFGPVLVVIPYGDDDEAVAIANDSEYGLAASIWSTDNSRALELAQRIETGSVWINDAHQINCQVPFGGYKQSGVGRELGPDALDAYTEVKTVHLDLSGGREAKPYDILLSHADD